MTVFESDLADTQDSMHRLMWIFAATIFVLFFGIGGWAVVSKVESAVVANGNFIVKSSGQAVQHLHGGVVGKLLVKEGDVVRKGQVVMTLDAAQVEAQLGIVKRELVDLSAEQSRLLSEHDGRATVRRPVLLKNEPNMQNRLNTAMALQQNLLNARLSAFRNQLQQFNEQKSQTKSGIIGLRALVRARQDELEQNVADLKAFTELDRQRLVRKSVLRQTRRQVSRSRGDVLEISSRISTKQSKLSEIDFRMREIVRKTRSEVLDRLQIIKSKIGQAVENYKAAKDRMTRLDVLAPSAGIVHELQAHTIGGVIKPGQAVMMIVPQDDPLEVVAQIKTTEVDQVKISQKVAVRISALDHRASPELDGTVIGVSPDRSIDERSGLAYFKIRISIEPGQQAKLKGKKLTAGLPAEVFIRGKARRVISYLTQPLRDQIGLTFKEE
jgi:HlyD family secretion protein